MKPLNATRATTEGFLQEEWEYPNYDEDDDGDGDDDDGYNDDDDDDDDRVQGSNSASASVCACHTAVPGPIPVERGEACGDLFLALQHWRLYISRGSRNHVYGLSSWPGSLAYWASALWYSYPELLTTVFKTCQLD